MLLKFIILDKVESTNTYLQEQQTKTVVDGWVVASRRQTAGRGMGDNVWESEAGKNLTFSMAFDMCFLPSSKQFALSKAVSLGIVNVLNRLVPERRFMIKWPNDIYCDGQKVGGVLINSTIKGSNMDVSVVGVGLNVNQQRFSDWPTYPTSLYNLTGRDFDLDVLLHEVAGSIADAYEHLKAAHGEPAFAETDRLYYAHLFRYQTWSCYEVEGRPVSLFMDGVDSFGRLLLHDEHGNVVVCGMKEIRFIIAPPSR